MSSSFSQIRQQIVSLEKQTEARLSSYSSYATATSSSATSDELKLHSDITELLGRRDALNSQLVSVLDNASSGAGQGSTSKLQQINRIKEKYNENKRDFDRIHKAIVQERNRLNLLTNVRSDIEEHQRRTEQTLGGIDNEERYMMEERSRIGNINDVTDNLLRGMYETTENFNRQRQVINQVTDKMFYNLSQVPGLNVLLSKINTRRKRDSLIIAMLITICIILLYFLS